MPIAYPCTIRRCDLAGGFEFGSDVTQYNLQDSLFFNGTPLSFVPVCPEGMICPPGSLPPIIVYPPGTFVVPKVPVIPGFPIVVQLMGCQSMVSITLPAGSSAAAIAAAANSVILQVAAQQAECDVEPQTPGNPNTPVGPNPVPSPVEMGELEDVMCQASGLSSIAISPAASDYVFLLLSGSLPTGITFSSTGGDIDFSGTATTFGTFTFKLMASRPEFYGEKTYTVKVVGITNTSPLTTATLAVAYLEQLTAGGPTVGTVSWAVTSGALPAGLTLGAASGQISGTPTTEETAAFTISITDSLTTCSKAFTLEVTEAAACADWTTLVWGPPNETTFGAGTTTVFAIQNVVSVLSCGSPGGDADTAIADITGSLIYNGLGCNCNLHIEMTANGNTNFVNCGVQIKTVEGGIIIFDNQFQTFGPVTIDQPFSLPDTGGLPFTVEVFAAGSSGAPGDSNTNGVGLYCEITNV